MSSFLRLPLFLSCFLLFFSCSTKTGENKDSSALLDSTAVALDLEDIGVTGDFDGDGEKENILVRVLNDANFHPDEPFSYSIEFSNPVMSPIEVSPMIGDGYFVLNEGNIDGKPGEELSIVVCNMNNAASLSIYGFSDKKWDQIAESVDVRVQYTR